MTIKLFFFDLEGTLVRNRSNDGKGIANLWNSITQTLGPKAMADDERMFAKWENGEYRNYMEWCKDCVMTYKKHGLTKEQFDALLAEAKLNDGVREVIAELHKRGIVTAIVSGGFIEQARKVQQELKTHHSYASTEILWNEDGIIDHFNVFPSDERGKVDYVELMRREYNLGHEQCAFVGDGKNDVHIAKHVGISFAYNGHPKLRECATHSIDDFRDILKHI